MNRGRPRTFEAHDALRTAMLVFWEKGYRNASIDDLTEAIGINRPSLYAAFGDKASLFGAALDLYVQDYGASISATLASKDRIVPAIEAFLMASLDCFCDKSLPGGCLIAVHANDTELEDPVRVQLARISELTEKALKQRYVQAIEAGEFDSKQSASQLAGLTYCVLSGLSQSARTGTRRKKLNAIAGSFVDLLSSLIR